MPLLECKDVIRWLQGCSKCFWVVARVLLCIVFLNVFNTLTCGCQGVDMWLLECSEYLLGYF